MQSVSLGRIWLDELTRPYSEVEAAEQFCYPILSQYTDTSWTSPSTDPVMPVVWQGHPNIPVLNDSTRDGGKRSDISRTEGGRFTTRPWTRCPEVPSISMDSAPARALLFPGLYTQTSTRLNVFLSTVGEALLPRPQGQTGRERGHLLTLGSDRPR